MFWGVVFSVLPMILYKCFSGKEAVGSEGPRLRPLETLEPPTVRLQTCRWREQTGEAQGV